MNLLTYKSLLKELRHNNASKFKEILQTEGLPQDDNWYDYDLLMQAIRLNSKRIVNYLLDKRCRVNRPRHPSSNSNTPLHLAAGKLGWYSIVEKMLKLKARVTDINADGNTPLHIAFINHLSDRVINLLLKHYLKKSAVDIRNKDGLGVMHIACMEADSKSVQDFFDVGMSDIYSQVSQDSDSIYAGYSPLHFAVEAGNHGVANFLCHYKADVNAQDSNGSTPIHLALKKNDAQMIDMLFYYNLNYHNYVNIFGVTYFMAACRGTNPYLVGQYMNIAAAKSTIFLRQMLNDQVKDNLIYPFAGYSALHFAAESRKYVNVKLLCEAKANLYMPDKNGSTPLHLALERRDVQMIDILFEYDEKYINCTNDLGLSHFMVACAGTDGDIPGDFIENVEGDGASLEKLLNERVKDIPDYQFAGYTAVHFASEFGRYSTIAGLLIGGDFHFNLTTQKLSPLDLARKNKHEKACKVLQLHCDHCEFCNDLVIANANSAIVIEMKTIEKNQNGKCLAAVKDEKGNGVCEFCKYFNIHR